ncbi:MAG TPA: hypothetical protein VFS16_12530, partial [Acidimicrobiia bacterium]|nr:hypothetical protein [Acidimicrobiia bacterium]
MMGPEEPFGTPARGEFQYRPGPGRPGPAPLPPLPAPLASAGHDEVAAQPEPPAWSPLTVALPLFAAVWLCFALLAANVTPSPDADIAGLGHLLATGATVVGIVFVT